MKKIAFTLADNEWNQWEHWNRYWQAGKFLHNNSYSSIKLLDDDWVCGKWNRKPNSKCSCANAIDKNWMVASTGNLMNGHRTRQLSSAVCFHFIYLHFHLWAYVCLRRKLHQLAPLHFYIFVSYFTCNVRRQYLPLESCRTLEICVFCKINYLMFFEKHTHAPFRWRIHKCICIEWNAMVNAERHPNEHLKSISSHLWWSSYIWWNYFPYEIVTYLLWNERKFVNLFIAHDSFGRILCWWSKQTNQLILKKKKKKNEINQRNKKL